MQLRTCAYSIIVRSKTYIYIYIYTYSCLRPNDKTVVLCPQLYFNMYCVLLLFNLYYIWYKNYVQALFADNFSQISSRRVCKTLPLEVVDRNDITAVFYHLKLKTLMFAFCSWFRFLKLGEGVQLELSIWCHWGPVPQRAAPYEQFFS